MVQQRGSGIQKNGDIVGLGESKLGVLMDKDLNHALHKNTHQNIPLQHNEKEVETDLIQT